MTSSTARKRAADKVPNCSIRRDLSAMVSRSAIALLSAFLMRTLASLG